MSNNYLRKFTLTNLVSNFTDPKLINAWGIVLAEKSLWVVNNGSDCVTSYDLRGNPQAYVFNIPNDATYPDSQSAPTGMVENHTTGFLITNGSITRGSFLLIATYNGTIAGWNPYVNSSTAITVIDNSKNDAVYTGLAIANNLLYVANFSKDTIDVYNSNYVYQTQFVGKFDDPNIPNTYGPYNIVYINGLLYVLYANRTTDYQSVLTGPGFGAISVFDVNGTLIKTLVSSGGVLNAPWGMIPAPSGSLYPAGSFFVANSGDGIIYVFDFNGTNIGQIVACNDFTILIDGIKGLALGYTDYYKNRRLEFPQTIYDYQRGYPPFNPGFAPIPDRTCEPQNVYTASGPLNGTAGLVCMIRRIDPPRPPCPPPCPSPCPPPCPPPCPSPCPPRCPPPCPSPCPPPCPSPCPPPCPSPCPCTLSSPRPCKPYRGCKHPNQNKCGCCQDILVPPICPKPCYPSPCPPNIRKNYKQPKYSERICICNNPCKCNPCKSMDNFNDGFIH